MDETLIERLQTGDAAALVEVRGDAVKLDQHVALLNAGAHGDGVIVVLTNVLCAQGHLAVQPKP